jgi:hypothetical protein
VYADNEKMQMMYGGFESWLKKYGKDITVGKIVKKHCIWLWRGGHRWIMICQGRVWNWNATSARRRIKGIIPIRVTVN